MKILQLCKKFPFPLKDGESIAVTYLAQAFAAEGHAVTLLAMNTSKHWVNVAQLPAHFNHYRAVHTVFVDNRIRPLAALRNLLSSRSYHIERFISADFSAALEDLLRQEHFDVIQLESIYLAPYVPLLRRHSNARLVLRAHNVEHEIWERVAANSGFFKRLYLNIITPRLKRYEVERLNDFDLVAAITARDAEQFRRLGLTQPLVVTPIGLDTAAYVPDYDSFHRPLSLSFIGSLDWMPNLEGLQWFLDQVWQPMLAPAFPDLRFHIAGRNAPDWLLRLRLPGVTVHGEVPDAAAFLNQHSVSLVPLLSGGGMRAKILEAMALGKVTLSTAVGIEGIDARPGEEALVADTPAAYLEAVRWCYARGAALEAMGRAARTFCERHFDNRTIARELLGFFRLILGLLLFLGTPLRAQTVFQNLYDLDADSAQTLGLLPGGRGLVAATHAGGLWLLQFDAGGAPLWSKNYMAGAPLRPTAMHGDVLTWQSGARAGWMQVAPDGSATWCRRLNQDAALAGITPLAGGGHILCGRLATGAGLVIKIDGSGNIVWSTTLVANGPVALRRCWEDAQGQLFCAGAARVSASGDADGLLLRLNQAGSLGAAWRYASTQTDVLTGVAALGDDRLLLTGTTNGFGDNTPSAWALQVRRATGEVVWAYRYHLSGAALAAADLQAIAGSQYVLAANAPTLPLDNPAVLFKITQDGNVAWAFRFRLGEESTTLNQVYAVAGGNYTAAGTAATGGNADVYVSRFNPEDADAPACLQNANLQRADATPALAAVNLGAGGSVTAANVLVQVEDTPPPVQTDMALKTGFEISRDSICPGECVEITVSENTPGAQYTFYPGSGDVVYPGDPPDTLCFFQAGTFFPNRRAQLNGCSEETSRRVVVGQAARERQVNAFTPDGDGTNDRFRPLLDCPPAQYHLWIYNRWGELLFESTDYEQAWDGTANGAPAVSDVYVWRLEYSSPAAPEARMRGQGEVHLLR